jgi:queuosine precursor transporter
VLAIVRVLPGEAAWQEYAGQSAYEQILGGVSSGGIVLASLLAYWLGSFSNAFLMARMKVLTQGRWLWSRTIGSTVVGQGVDTLVFVAVATLAGVFPWEIFASLVLTNYLFKVVVEALMTPATYAVVGWLKRVEQVDTFDAQTNFNPFRL